MVVLLMSDKADYRDINAIGFDLTEEDFIASDGVLSMLKIRAPKYYAAIPPADRAKIAKSPFKNQVISYNFVMDQVKSDGMANLMRLQELHFDVLLGNDITSPFIAD